MLLLLDILNNGVSKKEAAEHLGVSRVSVYNYLSRLREAGLIEEYALNLHGLGLEAVYIFVLEPLGKKLSVLTNILRGYGLVAVYKALAPRTTYVYKLYTPSSPRVRETLGARLRKFRRRGYIGHFYISSFSSNYYAFPLYCEDRYQVKRPPEAEIVDPYDYIIFKNMAAGITSIQEISRREVLRESVAWYHYAAHVENKLIRKFYALAKPINSLIFLTVKEDNIPLGVFSPVSDYVEAVIPYSVEVNGIYNIAIEAHTSVEKVFKAVEDENIVDASYYPLRPINRYAWSLGKIVEQQYYALLVKSR